MLVLTMTSWPKRIHQIVVILDSILRNNRQPDRLFLNLSVEEFPNKHDDLPVDLQLFIKANSSKMTINWIDGPNTRTFKKLVPVLQYISDDDLIITADDDFVFPVDLIESRLEDFQIFNNQPITPNPFNYESISAAKIKYYMSPTSLVSKKMFKNWQKWYTPELIDLNEDDRVNTYIVNSNGYSFMPSLKYSIHELIYSSGRYNVSNNDVVAAGKTTHRDTKKTEQILNNILQQ